MNEIKKNKPQISKKKNIDKKSDSKKQNLKLNLETLQNNLKEVQDENLRYLAEIDNLRKRFDKEREDTFKYAITEFANEIILVADNFERLKNSISPTKNDSNENVKPLLDGVDLIFKDFLSTLEKFDIKKIDCLGKKFDPNFHQAVSEEENIDKPEGEIVKIIQAGYLIKERLLRPASVIIAKKKGIKKK